jgi:hypothetical protein
MASDDDDDDSDPSSVLDPPTATGKRTAATVIHRHDLNFDESDEEEEAEIQEVGEKAAANTDGAGAASEVPTVFFEEGPDGSELISIAFFDIDPNPSYLSEDESNNLWVKVGGSAKKSGAKWSLQEDEACVKAVAKASQCPRVGKDQKAAAYYRSAANYYGYFVNEYLAKHPTASNTLFGHRQATAIMSRFCSRQKD